MSVTQEHLSPNLFPCITISKKIYPGLGMRHFLKLALSRLRFQGTNYFGIRRNHLERFHQISGILFSPPPPLFAFRWFCLHRKFQRSRRLHHFFLTKKNWLMQKNISIVELRILLFNFCNVNYIRGKLFTIRCDL